MVSNEISLFGINGNKMLPEFTKFGIDVAGWCIGICAVQRYDGTYLLIIYCGTIYKIYAIWGSVDGGVQSTSQLN